MKLSKKVFQAMVNRKLQIAEAYLLGQNEQGEIVDAMHIRAQGGCVFMPELGAGAITAALLELNKRGLSSAGIAINLPTAAATNADIGRDSFSSRESRSFNPSNIFAIPDLPVFLCEQGVPKKYVLNRKLYRITGAQ